MIANFGDAQGSTRAHYILFECFFRLALLAATAAAGAGTLPAQTSRTKNKPSAPPHDCGHGVSVRLSSPAATQGSLLEAEVRNAAPLADLKVEWTGHKLPLWQDATRKDVQRTLLGVDLEQAPGKYDLKSTAQSA